MMTEQAQDDVRIWVAVFTAPNAEIEVRDRLRALNYPVLLPTAMIEMRHARRTMMIDRPVFPRYVFVGIPNGRSWYPLKAVPGVGGVLSLNGEPQPMQRRAVDVLKRAIEADAFLVEDKDPYRVGESVNVTLGNADIKAFVVAINRTLPARRIDIMFKLFGKEFTKTVGLDQVRAA